MVSDFVDYIIPFHTGQSAEVLGEKGIAAWVNYKDSQSEIDLATGKKSAHQINIYTEVFHAAENDGKPIRNKRDFVEKFLAVCKENGLKGSMLHIEEQMLDGTRAERAKLPDNYRLEESTDDSGDPILNLYIDDELADTFEQIFDGSISSTGDSEIWAMNEADLVDTEVACAFEGWQKAVVAGCAGLVAANAHKLEKLWEAPIRDCTGRV